MADIKQIKLPNNTTYNIVDTHKSGIYTVIGTQTASTGSWTGALHGVSALYAGLTIMYYLPWAGSGYATLNLTLDNGTTTGAKNCYYNTGRLTTHYGKGCNIVMTYWPAGTIKVDGTATTDDRWIANANYVDGNDISTHRPYYTHLTAGTGGIQRNSLCMKCALPFANNRYAENCYASFTTTSGTGSKTYNPAQLYDMNSKIYYHASSNDVAAGSVTGNNTATNGINLVDLRYSFNITTSTLTANKPVYIRFEPNMYGYGRLYDPNSNNSFLVQDILTDDGADYCYYKYIGIAYDGYRVDLAMDNPCYQRARYTPSVIPPILNDFQDVQDIANDCSDDLLNNVNVKFQNLSKDDDLATSTDKTFITATLPDTGLYLIMASVYFASNATKSRWIYVNDTNDTSTMAYYARAACHASDASGTGLNVTFVYNCMTEDKKLYLRAKQNSGSKLACNARMQIIKLH